MAVAGVLIAVCVVCSPLSIPVGASRCFPVQHLVNILAAVLIGTVLRSGNGVCHISDKGLNGDGHFAGVSRKHVRSAALRTGI